jgi:hypothetical protein
MHSTLILHSLAFALCLAVPAAAEGAVRLAAFQAYSFSSKTGSLSADMLAKGAPELGNVPSGEFASVSTFITVKVDVGRMAAVPQGVQIRLLATESGAMQFSSNRTRARDRIILNSTSALGPANTEGMSYVGFWLPHTGCRTISLKASLVGVKDAPTLSEILPFTCYE